MIKGIGIDIVSNKRITSTNVESKFLNLDEKKILQKLNGEERNDFISGRWAAKESLIKASNKTFKYSEISILKNEDGSPKVLINNLENKNIYVSISHEKDYTVAFCIITNV